MGKQDDSGVLADLARQAAQLPPLKERIWGFQWSETGLALEKNGDAIKFFPAPVKMGTVLNFICQDGSRPAAETLPETLSIGPYAFQPRKYSLNRGEAEAIVLTDKERDILAALWLAPAHTLSREALLQAVWAYAQGVETHTLETHIYRLRQKMEDDPANPRWLVNEEGAYRLKP